MKKILTILMFAFSSMASAIGDNTIFVDLSVARGGGLSLGLDAELHNTDYYNWGAYGRFTSKDSSDGQDGITALGAFVRPHFKQGEVDFFVSPGFGLVQINPVVGSSELVFGPSLVWGTMFTASSYTIGFNMTHIYGWTGDYTGLLDQQFMLSAGIPF
jgi:hypothetical protein